MVVVQLSIAVCKCVRIFIFNLRQHLCQASGHDLFRFTFWINDYDDLMVPQITKEEEDENQQKLYTFALTEHNMFDRKMKTARDQEELILNEMKENI